MQVRYEKHWSGHLYREMEFKVYGHSGKPVLFIPCQAGRFWDFEGFNMDKTWAPWIESGEVMVFSCDSIDNEAWAAQGADPGFPVRPAYRIEPLRQSGQIRRCWHPGAHHRLRQCHRLPRH